MTLGNRVLAALAIGGIIGFASEMQFYITPEAALAPLDILYTWLFYSFTAWLGLGLAAWAGVRGWVALFLVGCIFGWVIEGIVVAMVYEALPWTLAFTAMSWHALVSGVLVLGVGRIAVHWPWYKAAGYWAALGIAHGIWGQFWVIGRTDMPADSFTYAYLLIPGLIVPIAHIVLDRLPTVYPYKRAELLILASLTTLLWAAQMAASLNPAYMVLPLAILPTLWILRRRQRSQGVQLTLAPAPAWRHFLFMLTPALTAIIATQGWQRFQNIESNWPIALLLTTIALCIYLFAAIAAVRNPK